jgi:hypothetical protein
MNWRKNKMTKDMFMTDQAIGAVMMALQKSLLEQSDIVPVLKDFKFRLSDDGLLVMNPPLVKFDDEVEEQFQDLKGIDVITDQLAQK